MSEDKSSEAVERELWERAAASEGITRADAYVALGRIAYEKGKFKDSLAICETARELFEQEKVDEHPRELFDVNVGISKNYEQLGKRLEAAQALGKAIEAAKIIEYEELDDLLRDQGRYWFGAGYYENSIACHQEAIVQTEMFLREESFGIDYFNIGMGLFELGRYQESIDAYLKSRAAFKASDEITSVVDCDFRLAENYAELKDPVNVLHYGQRALDFFTVLDDHRKMWTLKYLLGCAHYLLADRESAGQLLDEARNLAQAMGWKEWEFLIKVDEELAKIYEANLMTAQAAEIRRRVASIKDLAAKDSNDEAA